MVRYLLIVQILVLSASCAEVEPFSDFDGEGVSPSDMGSPSDTRDDTPDTGTSVNGGDDTGTENVIDGPAETGVEDIATDSETVPETDSQNDSETEVEGECKNNNQCDLGYFCNNKKLCKPCVVNKNCGIGCGVCDDPEHPKCSIAGPINLASLLLTGCGCTLTSCGAGRRCSGVNLPNFALSCEDCDSDSFCGLKCESCGGATPRCVDGTACGCQADEDCGDGLRCDQDGGVSGQCVAL